MLLLSMTIKNFTIWQWLIMLVVLVPSAIRDFYERKIGLFLCTLGLLFGLVADVMLGKQSIIYVVMGLIPGIIMITVAALTKEAIGYGDGIITLVLGVVLGIKYGAIALLMAIILSAVTALILLITKRAGRKTEIAFSPFILAGTIWAGLIG